MTTSFIIQNKSTEPKPAVGRHAECLADIEKAANKLLRLVAAERSGTFDGFGEHCWIGGDAVLVAAREIVRLAEWRVPLIPRG